VLFMGRFGRHERRLVPQLRGSGEVRGPRRHIGGHPDARIPDTPSVEGGALAVGFHPRVCNTARIRAGL
jgi:hypothetical protein